MTEGPGIGGYPDLQKPNTRVTQAYRLIWVSMDTNAKAAWKRAEAARRAMARIGVVRH